MSESEGTAEAPESHPAPAIWWRHIRWQSYLCLLGLLAEAFALIRWGIPGAATAPLTVANIGLVAVAAAYGGGSTLIDAIKAWRAPES